MPVLSAAFTRRHTKQANLKTVRLQRLKTWQVHIAHSQSTDVALSWLLDGHLNRPAFLPWCCAFGNKAEAPLGPLDA